MASIDWTKIALVGAAAIAGVYVIRNLAAAGKDAATDVVDAVRDSFASTPTSDSFAARAIRGVTYPLVAPISTAVIATTLPGDIELRGIVQLPNGKRFSMDRIRVATDLSFVYEGARYRIARREGNTYYAVV